MAHVDNRFSDIVNTPPRPSNGDVAASPERNIFNFNSVQRALVLEDYAPSALRVQGFVSRKKGARSMGEEKKEGGKKIIIIINKKLTGKIYRKRLHERARLYKY